MNRTRLAVACALALVVGALGAGAAPVPVHLMPKPELFYPTKLGAKHVSVWNDQELVEVVSKVTPVEGGYEVETDRVTIEGKRLPAETVVVTARGLVRTHSGGNKLKTPCVMLRVPHHENNTWKAVWGLQERALCTAGWEEIDVPAGRIRALRVDHNENGRGAIDSSHWYAPDIGCVSWYSNTGKTGRPLKSFTPGR